MPMHKEEKKSSEKPKFYGFRAYKKHREMAAKMARIDTKTAGEKISASESIRRAIQERFERMIKK